ncbi:amidohydrolase family protein [Ramlibacter sp. AW1]|uniref:Amidohydrolase family protein n=2 Tax=Ramlibacter aurantiacus TaxID=2801330 RepID=A0A936ZKA2_9BURK|nr:amidohydrolase family protein [Ramlibacter aurantiacus]
MGAARAQAPSASAGPLPSRSEWLLRGGHVLTMDGSLGDLPVGDVHVREGTIVAVGPKLDAPGAQVVDCRERIVLPGFVDTHWHLWCTALRMVIRADDPQAGYFPTTIRVGPHFTPQDSYIGVRLGVSEGLLSGITTVHDWSHNTVTPEHADAELQALRDLGIRARFSYGASQAHPNTRPMNLQDLARVQKQWASSDGMLGVGACLRTPGVAASRGSIPVDLFRSEFDAIRKLDLPMTIHCGPKGLVELMGNNQLLGPDMLLVHPQGMNPTELKMVGDHRAPWSIAPVIEMSYSAVRNGIIQYEELSRMGVPLGLSIDASAATNADFFNVMRALMWSDWQRHGAPQRLKPRRLVELATLEGARLLGLGDKVGSLTPGKRADIVTVRTDALNMAPVGDPYYAIVFNGQPSNVDTVWVDGRVLVQGGRHTALDPAKTMREAAESARAVNERATRR